MLSGKLVIVFAPKIFHVLAHEGFDRGTQFGEPLTIRNKKNEPIKNIEKDYDNFIACSNYHSDELASCLSVRRICTKNKLRS